MNKGYHKPGMVMRRDVLGLGVAAIAAGVLSGSGAQAQTRGHAVSTSAGDAWGFGFDGLTRGRWNLSAWRGRPILVVNTASRCGYTGQYQGLEALWQRWRERGLVVLGVPSGDFGGQELGSNAEVARFCELNYGVSFPMAAIQSVRGPRAHPFYAWARATGGAAAEPRWNFHKILIGPDGRVAAAFPSAVAPEDRVLQDAIRRLLAPAR